MYTYSVGMKQYFGMDNRVAVLYGQSNQLSTQSSSRVENPSYKNCKQTK
jgi:hypothetical protein